MSVYCLVPLLLLGWAGEWFGVKWMEGWFLSSRTLGMQWGSRSQHRGHSRGSRRMCNVLWLWADLMAVTEMGNLNRSIWMWLWAKWSLNGYKETSASWESARATAQGGKGDCLPGPRRERHPQGRRSGSSGDWVHLYPIHLCVVPTLGKGGWDWGTPAPAGLWETQGWWDQTHVLCLGWLFFPTNWGQTPVHTASGVVSPVCPKGPWSQGHAFVHLTSTCPRRVGGKKSWPQTLYLVQSKGSKGTQSTQEGRCDSTVE